MQTNLNWTRVLLAAGFLASLLAPLAAAQVGTFGSQVKVGDLDFMPVSKKDSFVPAFYWMDSVGNGRMQDYCVVMSQLIYKSLVSLKTVAGPAIPTSLSGATNANPSSSTIAGLDAPTATMVPSNGDIRMTNCKGALAGTLVAGQDQNQVAYTLAPPSTSAASAQVTFQYLDMNGNNKYDTGDALYLVNNPANAGAATAAVPGVVSATGGAGSTTPAWSVRLTPALGAPAGAMVLPTDPDFVQAQSGARFIEMSASQREDKSWYLVPAKPVGVVASTPIPAFSVRIATTGVTSLQPAMVATQVVPADADKIQTGKPFAVIVTVLNNGGGGGLGLLVTKLDHQIVDARLTPMLSPGETAAVVVMVPAPTHGGTLELEVNDNFQVVNVKGDAAGTAAGSATSTSSLSALQAQVTDLQQQLAALKSGGAVKQQGAPGLAPLALVGSLLAVALYVRRRTD